METNNLHSQAKQFLQQVLRSNAISYEFVSGKSCSRTIDISLHSESGRGRFECLGFCSEMKRISEDKISSGFQCRRALGMTYNKSCQWENVFREHESRSNISQNRITGDGGHPEARPWLTCPRNSSWVPAMEFSTDESPSPLDEPIIKSKTSCRSDS